MAAHVLGGEVTRVLVDDNTSPSLRFLAHGARLSTHVGVVHRVVAIRCQHALLALLLHELTGVALSTLNHARAIHSI